MTPALPTDDQLLDSSRSAGSANFALSQYDELWCQLLLILNNGLPIPISLRDESRIEMEVCKLPGMTRAEWRAMQPMEREPWLAQAIAANQPTTSTASK